MAIASVQSTASEAEVRTALVQALTPHGAVPVTNEPGSLILDVGSVGMAFAAGPFRNAMKMPMRITILTPPSGTGTDVEVNVTSRSTGSGFASGGFIGMRKQKKGEEGWLAFVVGAIPGGVQQAQQ